MIVDEQHDLDKAKENVYILERGLLEMITTWLLETRTKLFLIFFNTATKIKGKFCNFFCSFCQMVCKESKKQIRLEIWKIIKVWLKSTKYIPEIYGKHKRKQNHICKKSLNFENYWKFAKSINSMERTRKDPKEIHENRRSSQITQSEKKKIHKSRMFAK